MVTAGIIETPRPDFPAARRSPIQAVTGVKIRDAAGDLIGKIRWMCRFQRLGLYGASRSLYPEPPQRLPGGSGKYLAARNAVNSNSLILNKIRIR
jgi:hypothetical protein